MTRLNLDGYSENQIATIQAIRELKKELNAVVLSHFYMPTILQVLDKDGGVADFTGDSFALSQAAATIDRGIIIFCGVRFMAETAKILNPDKTVYISSMQAGCSLAESITGNDVRKLREKHPGAPVVAYINTYAETKAEADICCTSRNALAIAASFESDTIIFVPDYFMGKNLQHVIAEKTGKKLILWEGSCEVHEQFTKSTIASLKYAYPDAAVLVHWEVPDEAVSEALADEGMVGSTTDIINFVKKSDKQKFIIGSECDLGSALKGMFPEKEFIAPCISCRHMKQITLEGTLSLLQEIKQGRGENCRIELDDETLEKAKAPLERMLTFV